MPKPRRRRRFFALEGRFEVDDTGEPQGIVNPASADPLATAAATGGVAVHAGKTDPEQGDFDEESAAVDPSATDELPPAFRLNREPRSRPESKRLFSFPAVLLGVVCLIGGTLAGSLWSRSGQKSVALNVTAGIQKDASPLTAADQRDLDAAYAARHAHNYPEAERIFAELGRRHADWGPIQVEIGRTFFYANKAYDASSSLKNSIEKGWKPAEAYFLLGVMNKSRQLYSDAETSFAKAVEIDPTQPDYYFFWGECLREQGKLLDATAKFRSALLRNQYETATGLYRAKLWLCAVEADQAASNGVDAEIDASLVESHPPMEAFVAAAARDLKAGDLHAAVAHLSSGSQRADPIVFRYIISDPFFAEARSKPEFAEIFRPEPPSASLKTDGGAGSPSPAATP